MVTKTLPGNDHRKGLSEQLGEALSKDMGDANIEILPEKENEDLGDQPISEKEMGDFAAVLEQGYAGKHEDAPAGEEKERETATEAEAEAVEQFEKLPPEQKLTIIQNISEAGFKVEKWKNEGLAWVFGSLAGDKKTHARDKSLQRFFDSTKDIFERDAKRAEQSLADLHAGKEAKLRLFGVDIIDIKTLRGSGFLWGNIMKIGRSVLGPFAWANTGLMAAGVGFEAAKEARLGNEDVMEKTRIQDIDQAEDAARRIYQEAKEKAGAGNAVSKETLEKAYQEGIPKDLLERLAKNIEPGVENSFWQKVLLGDMEGTVEKMETELAKIDADEGLSDEARNSKKDAYLNNWFTRSQRLKDYDRIVSQNGEIDALASLARYGEFTAKAAVYGMMADSMRRVGTTLANFFSQPENIETITGGAVPVAGIGNTTETLAASADNTIFKEAFPNTSGAIPKDTLADEILRKSAFSKNYELPVAETQSSAVVSGSPIVVAHEGTWIPEAVKVQKEIFPAPSQYSAAETLAPRQSAIEQSLSALGKTHEVIKGDTIWGINKAQLGGNEYWNGLTNREQNIILDTMRHDLLNHSKEELIAMGIKSGDINRIYPGDKIDLSKVFDKNELSRIFNRAEHLQTTPGVHVVPEVALHHAVAPAIAHHAVPSIHEEPIRLAQNEGVMTDVTEPLRQNVHAQAPEIIAPTGGRFEAYETRTQDMPFYNDYKSAVYAELHLHHPGITIPMYDMKMREFLASNPNGLEQLKTIFNMKGVETPGKLPPETMNGSVLDYLTRQMVQHDLNKGLLAHHMNTHNTPMYEDPTARSIRESMARANEASYQSQMGAQNISAFNVPREQIPPEYRRWVQDGMRQLYPDMSEEARQQIYQQRIVDMAARDGYNQTADTVNRVSQLFGAQMPVTIPYQHVNDTFGDVLARGAMHTLNTSGKLPRGLPDIQSSLRVLGQLGSPDPTDRAIAASQILPTVAGKIEGIFTQNAINRSMGR